MTQERIQEIENKIAALQKELEELKNQKPEGLWKPAHKDKYVYVTDDGGVCETTFFETHDPDIRRIKQGNYHRSVKTAEHHVKKLKVLQKIREIAESDGWVADWNNAGQTKWYIHYEHEESRWSITCNDTHQRISCPYMSKQSAERCVAELGDELNVLLEG